MKNSNNKRAVIYVRVSTKEQVDEGNSLSTQEKNCRDYAIKNNYEIPEIFIEQGESAKTADRTELQKMLLYCSDKKNGINAVIIYKLDRLSRNTDDYSHLRMLLKKYGVEIKSTSEFFEDTPQGKFMENMFANVAQFDNDVRAERCSGGMKTAMREGRYVWMAPIGYSNVKVVGRSTIAPNEMAPLVCETFEMIAKGTYNLEDVRKIMTEKGLRLRSGGPVSKQYFYNFIKNKIYFGCIEKFGESHKGLFEPIVTEELFYQVQRLLKNRGKKMSQYKLDNEDFPLRRFILHPNDPRLKITGSWSGGRSKKYPYYTFGLKGTNYNREKVEEAFMLYMDEYGFDEAKFEKLKKKLAEKFNVATKKERTYSEQLTRRIQELQERQNLLIQKNLNGVISDTILKQQLESIEVEIGNAQVSLIEKSENQIDSNELMDYAKEYLMKPSSIWKEAKLPVKTKLQWFEFPQGLTFDGEKFRTAQVANVFNTKSAFLGADSDGVDLSIVFLNHVLKELQYLVGTLSN